MHDRKINYTQALPLHMFSTTELTAFPALGAQRMSGKTVERPPNIMVDHLQSTSIHWQIPFKPLDYFGGIRKFDMKVLNFFLPAHLVYSHLSSTQ